MHTVTQSRHLRAPQCDIAGEYGILPPKCKLCTQLQDHATFVLPKVASQESMESYPLLARTILPSDCRDVANTKNEEKTFQIAYKLAYIFTTIDDKNLSNSIVTRCVSTFGRSAGPREDVTPGVPLYSDNSCGVLTVE